MSNMFDELIRELRRLDGAHEVKVAIASDVERYLDRECPSSECMSQFKVHEDDWRDKARDDEVFCPFCGHSADSRQWFTQEQIEQAKQAAVDQINQQLSRAMKRDAARWNQSQPRDSFIRLAMQVDDGPQPVLTPLAASETMRLKITCPCCSCRYAVIGAAFFCPACGHNSADIVFVQSVTAIRNAVNSLSAIRVAMPDRDSAETTARLIIESGLLNAVAIFQRYAEILYSRYTAAPKARRNAFQNLLEGSELWQAATGKSYSHYLDTREMADLMRFFQQRHLLAHTQGIVDADYISRTADSSYRVGQRLVIREPAIHECLTLIEKLSSAMAAQPFK